MRSVADGGVGPASERERRLAAALKANLKRRKAQQRERGASEPDLTGPDLTGAAGPDAGAGEPDERSPTIPTTPEDSR